MINIRLLAFLCSGLCWVSCDKPEVETDHEKRAASTKSASHDRRVSRAKPLERPADFRTQLESAARIESPLLRNKALADVAWNAIEMDPDVAHEAFRRMPAESPEKIRLIQHYALRLAEQDPDEAVDWANTLETERETAAAMAHIALELAVDDPHRAANLLSESGIAGREFDVVLVQVIQRWASQSAPDAAAWVSSFPMGEARFAGIKAIMERWLPHDAPGAFEWLAGIPDGVLRDETVRTMQGVILQQPKETRENWLQEVNAGTRDELERQTAHAIADVGNNIPPQAE